MDSARRSGSLAIFVLPLIVPLVYLIVRGGGMADRSVEAAQRAQEQQVAMAKTIVDSSGAGTSSADQIAQGKQLLDSGAITADEYAALKAKALKA